MEKTDHLIFKHNKTDSELKQQTNYISHDTRSFVSELELLKQNRRVLLNFSSFSKS
jgi:hypothetical protein